MPEKAGEREQRWMRAALALAAEAGARGEVPIGAVVVRGDELVGSGYNLRETAKDALRHAEIDAIGAACKTVGAWRLTGCELFVTLEPCLMCAGAIYQARLDRVVFAAPDPKGGAMGSLYKVHEDERLNHRLPVTAGVLEAESAQMLRDFFKARRK